MITGLELKNIKHFESLHCDFRTRSGEAKDLIVIYGDSASGKSVLIQAIYLLLNLMLKPLYLRCGNDCSLLRSYRGLDTEQPTSITLHFHIYGHDGSYSLEFNDHRIIREDFEHLHISRKALILHCRMNRLVVHPKAIQPALRRTLIRRSQRLRRGRSSAFSSLIRYRSNKASIDSVIRFLRAIWLDTEGHRLLHEKMNFTGDVVDSYSEILTQANEEKISSYLSALFPHIESAYYRRNDTSNPPTYDLIYEERVGDRLVSRSFAEANRSVQRAMDLFPFLLHHFEGETVIIDDFDQGLQYQQVHPLFYALMKQRAGQMIITVSNTDILDILDTSVVHVLKMEADQTHTLLALNRLPSRTYQQNSIRRKFLRADYACNEAIDELDLQSIFFGKSKWDRFDARF